jgi:ubiquinone/menaquinone biosynthesis C-methylase UbiE
MAQLAELLDALRLCAGDRVLDLGCGSGLITEYLHDQTGAAFVGIDISAEAIGQARARTRAKRGRLAFGVGNMNRLAFGPETFSAVVAIDTLYYVNDLEATLRQAAGTLKPGGQLGLFYTQWINDHADQARLLPENTDLAVGLKKLGLKFTTLELTRQEAEHWRRKVEVLTELKGEFEAEGNLDLYDYRYSEAARYAGWDVRKRSRHLYHARL